MILPTAPLQRTLSSSRPGVTVSKTYRFPLWVLLTAIAGACATTDPRVHVSPQLETPRYMVQMQDGQLEVRHYAPRVVATVRTVGDRDAASRAGFKRLARYIFGGNQEGNRVAMTAPVSATPNEQIGGAKVGFAERMGGTDAWQVMFTMPSTWTLDTLPVPLDDGVELTERPGACCAVHVFAGLTTDRAVAERTQQLVTWLKGRGMQPSGEATVARYNTPWTLPWKRRNEILIPVTDSACRHNARSI